MTHQQIAAKAWQQTNRPQKDPSRPAEDPLPESVRDHPRVRALEEAIAALAQVIQIAEQDLAATVQELLSREQVPAFQKARALFAAGWRLDFFDKRGREATSQYHLWQEGTQTSEFYPFQRGMLAPTLIFPRQGADLFARLEIAPLADREQVLEHLVVLTTEAPMSIPLSSTLDRLFSPH